MSLEKVLSEQSKNPDDFEVYHMLKRTDIQLYAEDRLSSLKTLLVKKMDIMFDDQECQIINITDLSAYIGLKKE